MNLETTPVRVFISYSWTNDEHVEWVVALGERLMADGIDVVLDQWSLKDGQDLNAFMEQMVSDATITRVLVVCDCNYAKKADSRKGGVGTESQIISKEVYDRVDQEKFIPLLRERDSGGRPCLPIFLSSRKYIDFTNQENDSESYDLLLRNIYERPRRKKPPLGQPPAHLFEENASVVSAVSRAKRFVDFVLSGRGRPSAAFEDFSREYLANLEELRLTYSHEQEGTWCRTLLDNIEKSRIHRDILVDVVGAGIRHIGEAWFIEALVSLLEQMLPFQERPDQCGTFFKCSEDNYKFILYEAYLYALAICIQAKKFSEARALLDHRFVSAETYGGQRLEANSFTSFNSHPSSLEGDCANRGNTRRLSVMADLVHDRATRKDIHFRDLLQADVVACIASSKGSYVGWYPRCTVYSTEVGKLELFMRATTIQGFKPLQTLLGFADGQGLIRHLCSDAFSKVWSHGEFWRCCDPQTMLNIDELNRAWNVQDHQRLAR